MAPLVLSNNFKFKYFFSVPIPTKNLITPTTNLVSCNVFDSINTNEQRNFPHAPKLQSFSLEIFVVDTDVMFNIVNINVHDEYVLLF